ncbi:MAG: hypothetical protein IJ787_04265 [Bacilli bacterium]|nr:hypothetical protein [Bacilli bacterium]
MLSNKRANELRIAANKLFHDSVPAFLAFIGGDVMSVINAILASGQEKFCADKEERQYFETCFFYRSMNGKRSLQKIGETLFGF